MRLERVTTRLGWSLDLDLDLEALDLEALDLEALDLDGVELDLRSFFLGRLLVWLLERDRLRDSDALSCTFCSNIFLADFTNDLVLDFCFRNNGEVSPIPGVFLGVLDRMCSNTIASLSCFVNF